MNQSGARVIRDPRTRALDLQRVLEDAIATRRVETAHATALFRDELPLVADLNVLRVEAAPAEAAGTPALDAGTLMGEADAVQAGLPRRSIRTGDAEVGRRLAPAFAAAGWLVQRNALMVARDAPDRPTDTSAVQRVDLERIAGARAASIREQHRDAEVAAQVMRAGEIEQGAFELSAHAAIVGGEVAAYCLLQLADGAAKLAEIGAVARSAGRGVGRAVVWGAVTAARRERAGTIVVECIDDEWQKAFYRRLGFVETGTIHRFVRPWGDAVPPPV